MRAVHWFRKGLRLHDNPALVEAVRQCGASSSPADACVYAVFVLDPWFVEEGGVGANRWRFLLESLADLHAQLEAAGSKLFVLQGRPEEVLPAFFAEQRVTLLTFEVDTEPYAVKRDSAIVELAAEAGIATEMRTSHTLFEPERLLARKLADDEPARSVQRVRIDHVHRLCEKTLAGQRQRETGTGEQGGRKPHLSAIACAALHDPVAPVYPIRGSGRDRILTLI